MAAVSCRDPYVTVSLKRKTVVCVPKNGTGTMHSPEALDLDLRRDSAPAARRPCKDVVTTYEYLQWIRTKTVRTVRLVFGAYPPARLVTCGPSFPFD